MTTRTEAANVFLSFSWSDQELAREVSNILGRAGLHVVSMDDLHPGDRYSEEIREALRESDAVVVVLSDAIRRRDIPASVLFEIGAAAGANKPIFVIVEKMTERLPFSVPQMKVLPVSRTEEIVQQLVSRD